MPRIVMALPSETIVMWVAGSEGGVVEIHNTANVRVDGGPLLHCQAGDVIDIEPLRTVVVAGGKPEPTSLAFAASKKLATCKQKMGGGEWVDN